MHGRRNTLLWSLRKCVWLMGCAFSLSACLGGGGNTSSAPSATFLNLGFLTGYSSSEAVALSSDGMVAAGTAATAAGNRQAFRWNAQEGVVGIAYLPGGTHSNAKAISANGAVIVGSGDATDSGAATPSAAFRWAADVGMQRVESLPGSALCDAGGVSGDGATVAGTCLQNNNTAFRWMAPTGPIPLSRFGGGSDQQSTAAAISADGAVIAGAGHPVLTGAVIWRADGSATVLGKLPGDAEAIASAASRDGSVVVGSSKDNMGNYHAFRWAMETGMVALGRDGDGFLGSFATSISGDGRMVVGWGTTAAGDVALIWDADHGLRQLTAALLADYRLQIEGWKLIRATAISGDGRTIAGSGTNPQGQTEAWIVKLPD